MDQEDEKPDVKISRILGSMSDAEFRKFTEKLFSRRKLKKKASGEVE